MPEVRSEARDLVATGVARLHATAAKDARREAITLWCGVSGQTPGGYFLSQEQLVGTDLRQAYAEAVDRRLAGEPIAYVTGSIGFRRLVLKSDARALIPRPETEGLVDLVLQMEPVGVVADIGTGCGCVALSLEDEGRFTEVLAVDVSTSALTLARENAGALGSSVRLFHGDLCAPLGNESCDVVVANLPYLTEQEYGVLDGTVKGWEPKQALVGGEDGLFLIGRLIWEALRVVRGGGLLALEIDSSRAAESAALAHSAGWRDVTVTQDLFGRDRFLTARREKPT